jgi:glycosyltransferase involved in cell wall biosynthesis
MRILIVNSQREVVGGTEQVLRRIMRELDRRGHQLALLHASPQSGGSAPLDQMPHFAPSWCAADGADEALRSVSEWSPELVFVHTWNVPAIEKELLHRYPSMLFVHDYHRTCPTGIKWHGFPAPVPCSRRAGAMCMVLHYPARCGGLNPLTAVRRFERQAESLELVHRYGAVLVASRHMYNELATHGVNAQHLHLAPLFPGEMTPDDRPPEARPVRGNLLMVSRLVDQKGGHYLLDALPVAARELGFPLALTIAGEGPAEERLRRQASRLNVPVQFTGWLAPPKVTHLMRDADLLLAPSIWPEPFGLVGLEAGCVGLPAVAYRSGGVEDWLLEGTSGELAPADPPTAHGLAKAIVRSLRDPEHHQRLRRGAWETARRFTLASHIEILESVMERVTHDVRAAAV